MHFSSLGQSDQEKFSNVFISDTRQHEIYNLISTFKIMFISLVANKKNLKFLKYLQLEAKNTSPNAQKLQ